MNREMFRLAGASFVALLGLFMAGTGGVDADEHRVIVGMSTTAANVHTRWWHGENALDLTNRNGATGGALVYYQSHIFSGNGALTAKARNYQITTTCDGRYVDLYDAGGTLLGTLNYVHIASTLPQNYTWTIPGSGWTIEFLGTVLSSEDAECSWTGIHLHQGGVGWKTPYNSGLSAHVAGEGHTDYIDPTGNYTDHWLHKATTVDSDGDGCSDQQEQGSNHASGGSRDPHNYWDFYDVTGEKTIDLSDTLAILAHFGHGPNDDPEDNIMDRTIPNPSYPWRTAEANDGVDLTDALNNLSSFGDDCQ